MKPWEPSTTGNSWMSENQGDDLESNFEEDEDDDEDSQESGSDVEVVKEVTAEDRVIDNIGK